jgi:hypothetical protein
VYVYYGAVPAINFYVPVKDDRFIIGKAHRKQPHDYTPELLNAINTETKRLWLVFSHFYGTEKQLIVDSLQSGWDLQCVVEARGAALYLAHRRIALKS